MNDGGLIFDTGIDTSGVQKDASSLNRYLTTTLANISANIISKITSTASQVASAAIQGAYSAGTSFEASMSNVSALSGAAADELERLETRAKELGSSTMFSASQAADAFGYMALAGWDAEQMLSGIDGVLSLAAASGMELAQTCDIVTDYLSAFGLAAEDAAGMADMMAYAQANSNTNVEQLAEAYKNCAANMNAAGQSIETTTAMLAMLANQGSKGAVAGTKLTAIVRDITNAMDNGSVSINGTAIAVADAQGNFLDMADVLPQIESALNGLGTAERTAELSAVFTADSISGMNLLLNAGTENAVAFSQELKNCAGAASDMADTMTDNLAGKVTELNSALEGLGIAAYDKFSEPMSTALSMVTEKVSQLTDSVNGDLAGPLAEIAESLGDLAVQAAEFAVDEGLPMLVDALKWIADNKDDIITAAKYGAELVVAFKGLSVVSGVATGISSFVTAVGGATTATAALNAVLAVCPIALIGAGLVVGASALADWIDKQKEQLGYEGEAAAAYDKTNRALATRIGYLNELAQKDPQQAGKESAENLDNTKQQLDDNYKRLGEAYRKRSELQKQYDNTTVNIATSSPEDIERMRVLGDELIPEMDAEIQAIKDERAELEALYRTEQYFAQNYDPIYDGQSTYLDNVTDARRKEAEEYAKRNKEATESGKTAADIISGIYEQKTAAQIVAETELTDQLKESWDKLSHDYTMGIISSDEELYEKRLELLNKYGDESNAEYWSYYETIAAYEKEQNAARLKEQQNADDEALASKKSALDKVNAAYQAQYTALQNMQSSYRSKLLSVGGDVFDVQTEEDKDGNKTVSYTVNDIQKQIADMRAYHEDIKKLKDNGASSALLSELQGLSGTDAANMADYLANMSEAERAQIFALYDEKQAVADELSADLYADDAAKLQETFTAAITDIGVNSYAAGQAAAEQFASGFNGKLSELITVSAYVVGNKTDGSSAASAVNNVAVGTGSGERDVAVDVKVTGGDVKLDGFTIGSYVLDYVQKNNVQRGT